MNNTELLLAIELFNDLPRWRRRRAVRWYRKNNWDVTHEWKRCVLIARKMVDDSKLKEYGGKDVA